MRDKLWRRACWLCWVGLVGCGAAGSGADAGLVAQDAADSGDAVTAADGNDAVDAASVDVPADATTVVNFHLRPGFLNIAHRGGGKLAPEETLVAYQGAIAVGADVVECDVHSTLDDVLVCMHDDTVDRTTSGTGKIHAMTLQELRALDAGYKFTPDGGKTFPFRGQGHQVATLDEFLEVFPTGGYAIEIKQATPPIGPQVVQAIVQHGALDQTVLVSFSDQTVAEVRALEPRLTTGLALGEMLALSVLTDAEEATYVAPGQVIQAPTNQMDPARLVARAHRLDLKVQFWTINDAAEMKSLVGLGADGVFTDDPGKLAEVLGGL